MFPTEMEIMLDIAKNKDSGKQLISRPMDVVSEYICYLCDSLVRRGYIKGNKTKGYRLTSMGREIIAIPARNSGYLAQHTVAQDRAVPTTDEVVALCPKCKTFETLWFTSGRLNKTQKFRQEHGGVYHDCGSNRLCLLLPHFLKES